MYQILGVRWFTARILSFAVVAVQTDMHESVPHEWKAFLGPVSGTHAEVDEWLDEQLVAAWGAALLPQEAHGFFPHLPIEQYKEN